MTTIVVLFNLKSGADIGAYEAWARSTDLPAVNKLGSVDQFRVLRSAGLLGSDQAPAYDYVEIIEVNDMEAFGADVGSATVQKIAGEFQAFADSPMFILTEPL